MKIGIYNKVYIAATLLISFSCGVSKYEKLYSAYQKNSLEGILKYNTAGLLVEVRVSNIKEYGELIAVDTKSLTIFPNYSSSLKTIPKHRIESCNVLLPSDKGIPTIYSLAPTLFMLYHGFGLIASVPLNIIGIYAQDLLSRYSNRVISYSREPYSKKINWYYLRKFARFPQGIPKNIDRNKIAKYYYNFQL